MSATLSFKFYATDYNGWPKIKIKIDGVFIREHVFTDSLTHLDIGLDLVEGDHVLEIERFGKNDNNVDFRDGQIHNDQILELRSIMIDHVELPAKFLYRGTWCWNDHNEPGALTWGPNGTWRWQFATPVVKWALFENRSGKDPHPDLIDPVTQNVDDLKAAIAELEKLLET